MRRLKLRSETGATEIAQFPLTIYCLFLVVLLPVLNLVTLLIAGCTAYLATNDFAAKAATQSTFAQALNAMAIEAYNFQTNNLAHFVKMVPQGGYTGCGNDLYVLATNIGGSGIQSSAPDQSLTANIDTTKNIYELQVVSSYTVSPLISMASLPLLGSVPGLGQPVTLSFAASRPVEHPGGMYTAGNGGGGGGGAAVTPFSRVASSQGVPGPTSNMTWRDPAIFTEIAAAGQTIVSVNVVKVQADYGPVLGGQNGGWTSTGVSAQPGQNVWLDTQAVGVWGNGGSNDDANGEPPATSRAWTIDASLPSFMLIGYVGSQPILPYGHQNMGIPGDPHFIPSGDTLINFPINYAGPISLACNDNQGGDSGIQYVRIIVTR